MSINNHNPFDRYSSRTKRLNYFIPNWKDLQDPDKKEENDLFIGREDILYRLRNWILSKSKTGSFLVAGFRGMGKTLFVNKALYDITRQRRRSRIEFCFLILHLMLLGACCYSCFWNNYNSSCPLVLLIFAIPILAIFLYLKKYHIQYWWGYLVLYSKYLFYLIKNNESWKIFRILNKKERSRLDKILFHDYRKKEFRRVSIHINLGHEILTERDILCLIVKQVKNEVENFISNKHLYFIPSFCYVLVCCVATSFLMKIIDTDISEAIKETYNQQIKKSSDSELTLHVAQFEEEKKVLSAIHNTKGEKTLLRDVSTYIRTFYNELLAKSIIDYHRIAKVCLFIILYLIVRFCFRLTFKYIPGVKQFLWIRKRLRLLNERISSSIDEENSPFAEGNQGFVNISLGRRRKKYMPIANVREIESELIDILNRFDGVSKFYTLHFVIIFDELDKIDPELVSKDQEELFDTFKGTSGFTGESSSRERKDNVLRLLANMKHFISTARAKFIFISGRELYDAYLAGLSDREFAISSVFNGAIYVDSFLTSNKAERDIVSMTEQYICKMLLPNDYLKNVMIEKYFKYGITTPEYPSLKWYYRYLCELEYKTEGSVEEWKVKGGIIFLHYFSIYLTHISNGSPQKILSYFRMYVRTEGNLYRKGNKTPYIYGWKKSNLNKNIDSNFVLTFDYVNQRKIAFIFYMAYPIMQAIINNATLHGDKLLISASFLMNHIYKYHSYSFSWRNLEQAPELLEVYRTPELRTFIHTILSFMIRTHMTNIPSGLYNFKFRKSIAGEIAILSKHSEEISAIFNFTLDESLSVKKHYTRMLLHYSSMLNKANSNQNHYAILLSRIHQILGDLQLADENYLEAALEYRNSIAYLKDLLPSKDLPAHMASGDIILPIIRNMLKLGLTYEHRRTNNSAYVIYYELICMLIDFRYVDESKLGLKLKVEKAEDWRDKKYVLYRNKEKSSLTIENFLDLFAKQDEILERNSFEKEINTQFIQKEKDDEIYTIQGDELVDGLAKILTPEKSNLIFRLSLLEDLRLVYQAILAKLFVLEKVELGGITKANVDVAESEFRYLYRVTNAQDKFIILVDFFRRLAEILYYKNGLINRKTEKFVTGLYFWGYEFDTDIEDYCKRNEINIELQTGISQILNSIDWKEIGENLSSWKNKKYSDQWNLVKSRLEYYISHKLTSDILNKIENEKNNKISFSRIKSETLNFIQEWEPGHSYTKILSYYKVNECNKHRQKMLEEGRSIPCFACRYYNRSMHILLEHYFNDEYKHEDHVSKVRVFLKKANHLKDVYSLRPNYLQTIAILLDGMGNVQLCCSDRESVLSEKFLKQLAELSDDNHEFEKMEELNSIEKSILYYWAASRYYKMGSFLKDAAVCLKKILLLLKRYMTIEEIFVPHQPNRTSQLSQYICQIIENISRKAILYLYSHSENISIAEIQDLKGVFSLKPYEDISLEKLSLYPDIEEFVLLSMELKLCCYKTFQFNEDLMPSDLKKEENLNTLRLYSFRLSSIYNIEKTVQQQISESRAKAIWNYSLMEYLFENMGLFEYRLEQGNLKWGCNPKAPIDFYRSFIHYLENPACIEKLQLFGMDLNECKIADGNLSIENKLQLVEFLIKDSMFCLQRILSILTNNTSQLLHTNSYIAEIYKMMFMWAQIFKFVYNLYVYMETDEDYLKKKVLKSLSTFITSRYISMENEQESSEVQIDYRQIEMLLNHSTTIMREFGIKGKQGRFSTEFYNNILSMIEPTNLRFIISNYPAEMSLQYYNKAKEVHCEGNAYKDMIANLYYLDDDLQNDTEQFYMALERYSINCGYIDCMTRSFKDIYSKAYIYNIECYERGDVSEPYKNTDDPLWGIAT